MMSIEFMSGYNTDLIFANTIIYITLGHDCNVVCNHMASLHIRESGRSPQAKMLIPI